MLICSIFLLCRAEVLLCYFVALVCSVLYPTLNIGVMVAENAEILLKIIHYKVTPNIWAAVQMFYSDKTEWHVYVHDWLNNWFCLLRTVSTVFWDLLSSSTAQQMSFIIKPYKKDGVQLQEFRRQPRRPDLLDSFSATRIDLINHCPPTYTHAHTSP